MTTEFLRRVAQRHAAAVATGALKCIDLEHTVVEGDGLPFMVQWPSTDVLQHETLDAPQASQASRGPGQRESPEPEQPEDAKDSGESDSSPFSPPDPELTIGPVGDHHVALLNKFPACARHVLLARTEFQEQQSGVNPEDFAAIAMVLSAAGGLVFYNGGERAGASQRHKHLQWVSEQDSPVSLRLYTEVFNEELDDLTLVAHPGLPVRHCFVRVRAGAGVPVHDAAASMHEAYTIVQAHLGLHMNGQGFVPPFNLLIEDGWMLVVPRRQECFQDISVNALSYAGLLHVQRLDQVDAIRQAGPLAVLATTGYPWHPGD